MEWDLLKMWSIGVSGTRIEGTLSGIIEILKVIIAFVEHVKEITKNKRHTYHLR